MSKKGIGGRILSYIIVISKCNLRKVKIKQKSRKTFTLRLFIFNSLFSHYDAFLGVTVLRAPPPAALVCALATFSTRGLVSFLGLAVLSPLSALVAFLVSVFSYAPASVESSLVAVSVAASSYVSSAISPFSFRILYQLMSFFMWLVYTFSLS